MKIKNYKRYRKFIYGFIGSIFLLWGCSADKNAATADSGNSSEETQNAVAETEPAEREICRAAERYSAGAELQFLYRGDGTPQSNFCMAVEIF